MSEEQCASQKVVCAVEVASLWERPDDESERARTTQVVRGEPLSVLQSYGDWVLVLAAHYSIPGWLRTEFLTQAESNTALWLPQGDQDPLSEARTYLGIPYVWGGMTHEGIDCSGLVHMAYRAQGRLVPRDASQQEAAGQPIAWHALQPGDLITYGKDEQPQEGNATHIAFWLGGGRILHATRRDDVQAVVEEIEPPHLHARRRQAVRF